MDRDLHIVQPITSARLKGVHLSLLSDEDAVNISTTVVGSVNEVSHAALGLPTPNATECGSCGAKSSRCCEGHFGLIKFPFSILNPYVMLETAQVLNKICPGCKTIPSCKVKKAESSRPLSCRYCNNANSRHGYPKMKFRVSSKNVFAKSSIIVEVHEKFLDKSSDFDLASDYWDVIPKDSVQAHVGLPANKRVLSPAQDVSPEILEKLLYQKDSIFLNYLLITPNSHRVREFGQRITNDENTKMYRKLIDFRGTPDELSARILDRYKLSKLRSEKVSDIQRAYEKQSPSEFVSSSSGLKNIKDLLLGKRTDHSFRMVVVGDPRIKVGEVGLPSQIAENVLILDHINIRNWGKLEQFCDSMIKESGNFSVLRNGQTVTIWSKDMLHEGDSIRRRLLDGDIVLINRPPSIHQHSLIALAVKILPINYVMSINPIICNPLRGDFDGDCLHGYVPQSVSSRVELSELVSLENQLVNGQNGRNLLSLNQDSLTGAHLLVEDGVVLNKAAMQQLQMFCSCALVMPSVVSSSLGSSSLWTGKQLFSMLLPRDFEFSYPSNGVSIRNGEIVSSSHGSFWINDSSENLFQCLVRDYGERVLDILTSGQEVLCEWLTRRGLSVSLSDLYLSCDKESRKNLLDEIHFGLQEAQKLSKISLLMVGGNEDLLMESCNENDSTGTIPMERIISSARQSKVELFQASASASKSVLRDMQNLVYKFSGKNNSFISMLKAGSKGNLLKLFQQSMCLGLQHTLAAVSFSIPRDLSCAGWNNHKLHGYEETSDSYIPCTTVGSSFLAGLNPLECFMLSLTTRDSTFGGHADVSGTLTRKLMFFMRDLMIGYDGTIRNNHGNHVVQFNYCTQDMPAGHGDGFTAGHPVGSLAACAISEAVYSALDQPVSALEPSPLLNLKKVMECGVKRNTGCKGASLFLSRRLGRWANGLEYGALEVKDHLESLFLSDVVSEVKICFSKKTNSSSTHSPWVCHFHINKEVAKRRRLRLHLIINALHLNNKFTGVKSKITLPKLHITCKSCSEKVDTRDKSVSLICISVALSASLKGFSDLDILRDMVKPVLLQTVIKGFPEFKKVEIQWKESKGKSNDLKSTRHPSGELFLRVFMSDHCDRTRFWNILIDKSLRIRNLVDWDRSHPDDINDCLEAYGVDVAWQCFVNDFHSAIDDTGKTILPEHLMVTASCLSATGEFLPLSAKGLAHQRKEANIYSPFTLACFSNPSNCLVKAAKMGQTDGLQGSLEALAWGKTPSIGSGYQFDILYNGMGHEPAMPTNVYSLLSTNDAKSSNPVQQSLGESIMSSHFNTAHRKSLITKMAPQNFSEVGIRKISRRLKRMLKEYPINSKLKEQDKLTAMKALQFHPRWETKVGKGIEDIKVGRHPEHRETCFFLVRKDGTEEDFSYNKCIHHALEIIAPENENAYRTKEKVRPRRFSESGNGKAESQDNSKCMSRSKFKNRE